MQTSKNARYASKLLGVMRSISIALLVTAIVFGFTACPGGGGGGGGDPDLSGTITISPSGPVIHGTELTATYSGTEIVAYQWHKDEVDIPSAKGNKYTPNETGSYTVTVMAQGFNPKTSAAVIVNNTPDLQGSIIISPNTGVTTGMELTATYSGAETVAYKWQKGGVDIPSATGNKYTPSEAGSYTVTVTASGFNPKTSAPVVVSVALRKAGLYGLAPEAVTPASTPIAGVAVNDLGAAINYIKTIGTLAPAYTLIITDSFQSGAQTLDRNGAHLTIIGVHPQGWACMITYTTASGSLITLNHNNASITLGEKVELIGRDNATGYLVNVTGGSLIMKPGSAIFTHTTSSDTSAVRVSANTLSANLTMEGGLISDHKTTNSGNNARAVFLEDGGTLNMKGGKIVSNRNNIIVDGRYSLLDVYCGGYNSASSVILSGDAEIGVLMLEAGCRVYLSGPFTGEVNTLHLRSNNATVISNVVTIWNNIQIIRPSTTPAYNPTASDISRFTFLGKFFGPNNMSQTQNMTGNASGGGTSNYRIRNTGNSSQIGTLILDN